MIALHNVQRVVRRFFNAAVSTSVNIDKCTTPLIENQGFPRLELLDFEPLIVNEKVKASIGNIVALYNEAAKTNKYVPSEVNLDIMKELLLLETNSQRIKYLKYCFKKEKSKLNKENKKLKLLKEEILKPDKSPEPSNNHIEYGVGKTSLFMHFQKKSISKMRYLRQANSILFGQNIVLDLDYEKHMLRREIRNAVSQLTFLLGANRQNRDPYNVHFCNAKPSSFLLECLQTTYPCLYEAHGFISCTELGYLNLFPKERLIYLSPHASETLKDYDPSAVYIIGAFVDLSANNEISSKKAEEEDIKCYALPLDEHIMWGSGTKSLSINQVFQIMLELKNTREWKKALRFVPTRKMKRLDTDKLITEELPDKIYIPE